MCLCVLERKIWQTNLIKKANIPPKQSLVCGSILGTKGTKRVQTEALKSLSKDKQMFHHACSQIVVCKERRRKNDMINPLVQQKISLKKEAK